MTRLAVCFLATCLGLNWAVAAKAFNPADRWTSTATNGPAGPVGSPITLTWSIVPDGTLIPNVFPGVHQNSNLVASFDDLLGDGDGGELTQRPWFQRIKESFDRWGEISGLTFVYEPADDGANHGLSNGVLGTRGDIRLAGTFYDGNSGTLAYTIFPNNGDIVIDTGDVTYYGNSASNNLNLRNTVGHEIGHSFGLGHLEAPNNAFFLMEPFTSSGFDGPQFDDIRGVHHLYGDANEKSHGGAGNNTLANATELGTIEGGQSVIIGEHASTGLAVLPTESDFVSITNQNDIDYFSFTTIGPSLVDITLSPLTSTTYRERFGSSGASTMVTPIDDSNLGLEIYTLNEGNAVLLASSTGQAAGLAESVLGLELLQPGEYFARIAGSTSTVQMYQLSIAAEAIAIEPLAGDYNSDGTVDAADFVIWRQTVGLSGPGLLADGDGDELVDEEDLAIWNRNFGAALPGAAAQTTPEPCGAVLAGVALLVMVPAAGRMRKNGRDLAEIC